MANRNKILNKVWRYKNIIKMTVTQEGGCELLSIIIKEGAGYRGGEVCERVLALEVMCEVGPESKYNPIAVVVATSWC